MKSAYAVTYSSHDSRAAARELASGVRRGTTILKNSCAILFAEVVFNLDELLPALEEELGIPVMGCTSAAITSSRGYHRMSASLMLLTADDCNFGMSISRPLTADDPYGAVRDAYNEAQGQLKGQQPKVIFMFTGPGKGMLDDDIVQTLNQLGNRCPVIGGICSDYNTFDKGRVFLGTEKSNDSMLLLLISGNIKPKFAVSKLGPSAFSKSKVSKSEDSEVIKVDNLTAFEFLRRNGIEPENTFSFFFHPISLELNHLPDFDGETVVRALFGVNPDNQSAIFTNFVPEGTPISVRTFNRKDIEQTTRQSLENIRSEYRLEKDDKYTYSTVIGVSCIARHIVMAYDYEREGELVKQILPPDLNFMGCYSYGEFCPTSVQDGRANNAFHNISFTVCMF